MRLSWFAKSRKAARKPPSAASFRTEIIADVFVPERAEDVRFFSRKLDRPGRLRRFSNRDLRESLLCVFYLMVAAALPVRWWAPICSRMSRFRLKRHMRKEFPAYAAATRAVLGDGIDACKLFEGLLVARHRRRLQLAAHLVTGRWSPTIRLEGLEGLQSALRQGHGAILWCDQFTAQTIIGKRALYEAGIEAHQVSVHTHISETAFGLRFLNPPLINVENRFLKSRVTFDRDDAYQVTIRIQKILKQNGVVTMTNTIHAGTTFTEAAMGESGWTHLASAPANFAARGGTALFAMSTFEVVPFIEYRAVLSPALTPEASVTQATDMARDGTKNMAVQAHYILLKRDRLLEALKLYPEQMMTWSRRQRLTEAQDSTGIGTDEGS
ncbi:MULTISPECIES: hypothetical protein [unclassified Mesorhizobium]|uniref:hypothetical protein n=1 Tax=unclassified Mesorhizobium TaxID=325217 RepID=UPI000FCC9A50|nr:MULTISPECIES: hypothetical protein [unclassified Mesorhizobium]RUX92690.1 hypothetical protein EN993_22275 [Mesorhizobium sp. M7D.F.Ca.US.004.01.2.1]RVA28782.1 hypothetical protein EN935_17905 [Mesorhizobium sp. M7D.F.Ca.US.004.03.1.1]